MTELSEDRARVAHDLASVIESCVSSTSPDGLVAFHGSTRFASSLVGPPGRLHGGLHAYARTLPILEALAAHAGVGTYPCLLTLGLYRPLPLEESVAFHGTYARDGEGYRLEVDHAPEGKLHTVVTRATEVDAQLTWFHDAYARTKDESPEKSIRAQGDIPMHMFRELVVMPFGRAMRTGEAPSSARFVRADGRVDASAMCVALDLIAAVTQGYAWTSHIFTTRIDLVLETSSIDPEVELVILASRASVPDPECHVRPVELRDGTFGGPMKVRVILADTKFARAYAHGTFTLVPAKRVPDAGAAK